MTAPDRIPSTWVVGFWMIYPPNAPDLATPPDNALARVDDLGNRLADYRGRRRLGRWCPHGPWYELAPEDSE